MLYQENYFSLFFLRIGEKYNSMDYYRKTLFNNLKGIFAERFTSISQTGKMEYIFVSNHKVRNDVKF